MVDDRPLPRIAAKAMLGDAPGLRYVGEASSGAEALRIVPALRPDIVLMDVEMTELDGAETTRQLLNRLPDLTVIAWTVSEASEDLLRMIDSGCAGYVLKDVGPLELQRAIAAAVRREAPVPRRMLPDVLRRAARVTPRVATHDVSLTEREVEALRLIAKGIPTKRMASEMGIARSSVDTHLRNVYRKLGARNRGEAVSAGLRMGLINLPDL